MRRQPLPPDPLAGSGSADVGTTVAEATTGRSVLRGGVWNMGGQVLLQVYSIATSVVAARLLGTAGFGRFVFISFVEVTVALALSAGLPQAVMRYTSEAFGRGDPQEARGLQRWAWRVEGVGAAIGASGLAIVGALGATPRAAWVLAGIGAAALIMHHVPSALLIAAQRWRAFASISIVTGTVALAAKIGALWAGGGITSLFAVDATVAWVNLGVAAYLARRTIRELAPKTTRPPRSIKQVVRFAAVSSITIFVTFVVWRRTELFFLQWYTNDTQIAIYSIPFSAVTALLLIPTALGQAVQPAFATLFGAGAMARIRSGYGRAVRVSTLFTLPVTALALAVGPTLLTLVYGSEYGDTGDVLRILLVTFPVIPIMDMSNGLLIGLGKRWPQVIIGAVAAVLNIGLDFLLIRAHGAIGAAIANSSAQLIGAVPIIIYASRTIGWAEWHIAAVLRSAAAAATGGMAAVVVLEFLPGVVGLILGTLAGVGCFLLLARLLRILPSDDGKWLDQTIGGTLRGGVGKALRFASAAPNPDHANRVAG